MFIRISMAVSIIALVMSAIYINASGQDHRATISGLVHDPNNQTLAGVAIKVRNTSTNEIKETKSSTEGFYTLPYIEPGTYELEATASGFQTLKLTNLVLRVADKTNLPLKLSIGKVTEEVTVTSQELIETASADRGSVINADQITDLPLNGRQAMMLLDLVPGVLFTQESFGSTGFSGTRGWDVNNSLRINGARGGQNLFMVNGGPISNTEGMWQISPSVEAIQEFKVMTNAYDSSYGRFGGGVVNITLKSGTNKWRGNIYNYWRNAIFDANSFQSNYFGKPKDYHNSHQFGGALGGPIRKDKDFLFASFEGWQEVVPFPNVVSVPPTVLRDGKGFTVLGYKIYDPLTTHLCGTKADDPKNCLGQTYVRDPFHNNVIPDDRISPIGKKILSYFPNPNATGLNQNFIGPNVGRYYYNQPLVKWDHIFNERNKINIAWTYQHGYEFRDSTGFGRPAGTGNTDNQRRFQSLNINWNRIISPTTVFDLRAAVMRFTQITPGYSDLSVTPEDLGMTHLTRSPSNPYNVVPQINIGDYTRLFSSGQAMYQGPFTQWSLIPSVSTTKGKHTLRTGFEFVYMAKADLNTGNTNIDFNSGWTQQFPGRRNNQFDGNTVASILLGLPSGGSINYRESFYRTRPYYAGYIQDDWRVSQRLSLNIGIRYDVQVPWKERYNRVNRGFDPTKKHPLSDAIIANWKSIKATYDAKNPKDLYGYPAPPDAIYGTFLFPGKDGHPERMFNTDYTNIAPRLGIAFRLADKTVLRTGAGIYYQSTTQFNTTNGFDQGTPYINSLDGIVPSGGLTGPYSLDNPFPAGLLVAPGASSMAGMGGGNISFDPASFRVPRTYQFTFGIQQQIGRKISIEASYAGNIQIFATAGENINWPTMENHMKAFADPKYFERSNLPNPFLGILPKQTSLGSASTTNAGQLLRPMAIYGDVTNNLVQDGRYRADMFQLKIDQRNIGSNKGYGGVFSWTVAYTISKAFEANHRLNSWNKSEPLIYELDNQDKPNALSINGIWDLPFGKNRRLLSNNSIASALIGDWKLSGIFQYTSGNPVGWPNMKNSCNNDWKATANGGTQSEDRWFNNDKGQTIDGEKRPSCFAFFQSYTLRTIPDRFPDIRHHRRPQLNIALNKSINFSETKRLQFSFNVFNATNTPIRLSPSTDYNTADFGKLPKRQSNFPRQMQMGLKFHF